MVLKYFTHHIRLLSVMILATVCLTSNAQSRSRWKKLKPESELLVKQYVDSLAYFKLRQDTLDDEFVMVDGRYSRLFVPTTFYNKIARRKMSIDDNDTLSLESNIDEALLRIYLNKPWLVQYSEKALKLNDKHISDEPRVVKVQPDIVEQVAPEVEEPDVVPTQILVHRPNFWTFSGEYNLQFMQNYFSSNWYKGGESNYSVLGNVILQYNYNNKQKVKWENKLEMKLGYQTSKGDTVHSLKTSQDLLRYTTKLGLQATKRWYYTIQSIATTQFMRSYSTNSHWIKSDMFSPLNINTSIGMDYNVEWLGKTLTGSIHLAPFAYNFKYVGREALVKNYGIDEGHHELHDIGSEVSADLNWKLSDVIKWRARIYGYTTYHRSEIELENTITLKINKYLASTIFIYPRFDDSTKRDSHHGYWQFKEYCSLGFSYSF